MIISCREFAHRVSEQQDRNLPLSVRWKVGLHLFLCGACARYKNQLSILRRLVQAVASDFDDVEFGEELKLSEETRRKIRENIEK